LDESIADPSDPASISARPANAGREKSANSESSALAASHSWPSLPPDSRNDASAVALSRLADVHRVTPKDDTHYEGLNPDRRQQMDGLVYLFTSWPLAYDHSKCVWELMKTDPGFDVNILISRIPLTFADFLVNAIRSFMTNEGL
jgi:hypothetical protein